MRWSVARGFADCGSGGAQDEADRLLDMGFEETLTSILQLLEKKRKEGDAGRHRRQTVRSRAFSACRQAKQKWAS